MSYNAIIFTNNIPEYKTTGAYCIASELRQNGYKTKIIDDTLYLIDNFKKQFLKYLSTIIDKNTIFVGFSLSFMDATPNEYNQPSSMEKMMYFMKYIKKFFPYVKIIIGGEFVCLTYEYPPNKELMSELDPDIVSEPDNSFNNIIDHHVAGLGENAIIKLLEDIKNKKPIPKVYKYDYSGFQYDFHNSSNIFKKDEDFIRPHEVIPFNISRGCRFKCKFCTGRLLGLKPDLHKYVRCKEKISEEIEYNYKNFQTNNYFVTCSTFNETTEKLLMVKEAIEDTNIPINFAAYIRLDLLHRYPEQIEILKDIGIKSAYFGIETLYDPAAKIIGKTLGLERTLSTLTLARKIWGPDVFMHASFISGLPYESEKTIENWANILVKSPLTNLHMGALELYKAVYTSEFALNSEKYGYTILNKYGDWKSTHPIDSRDKANKIAKYYMKTWAEKGKPYLLKYGWKWKDIMHNPPSEKSILQKTEQYKQYYAERLLNS